MLEFAWGFAYVMAIPIALLVGIWLYVAIYRRGYRNGQSFLPDRPEVKPLPLLSDYPEEQDKDE